MVLTVLFDKRGNHSGEKFVGRNINSPRWEPNWIAEFDEPQVILERVVSVA
jgi:hypothetical protein